MKKFRVGILGATGHVGQCFILQLDDHPWFEITKLMASPKSKGKTYREAVGEHWRMDEPMPESVKDVVVGGTDEIDLLKREVDFVFSAVDMEKDALIQLEEAIAKSEIPVISNNSAMRWTPDVPLIIPEINPDHVDHPRGMDITFVTTATTDADGKALLDAFNFPFRREGQ